jgi:hypothetical protein
MQLQDRAHESEEPVFSCCSGEEGAFSALCKSFAPADVLNKHNLRALFANQKDRKPLLHEDGAPLLPILWTTTAPVSTRAVDSSHSPSVTYHHPVISLPGVCPLCNL